MSTSGTGRGLFISHKENTKPEGIVKSFRDVEQWANGSQVNRFKYQAGWTDFAGVLTGVHYLPGGFFLDPFGVVHLEGTITHAGALVAGMVSIIALLPPIYNPPLVVQFVSGYGLPTNGVYINVIPTSIGASVTATLSTNVAGAAFALDGFTYPVFQ